MSAKQKVLIVDDEPRNQRIVIEILEDLFELQVANSSEEAMECLKKNPPDLVLLDIMMPGMSGYDVCSWIRAETNLRFTKVILVSGKAMLDERLKGYACGADDYMTKPFSAEELLAKSKVFLRLTQAEKELDEINQTLDARVREKARLLLDAEIKLMNAAKMSALGEMAGGVAHEVNTPLSTILLVSEHQIEIMSEGEINKENILNAFRIIGLASKHIAKIVQGLRFFSRNSSTDPFTETDLSSIMENTTLLCAERFKTHNIELKVDCKPVKISCRPVEIAQVILNILNNSFHAVENQTEKWVKVLTKDDNDFVEISITDSGKNIPPSVREKLFQPFFTTKGVGKGTGLGLSISKGIVENHKGVLYLDEKSPQTCFTIRIAKNPETVQVAG